MVGRPSREISLGASGMWVIAAIRDEHVAQFAPDFHAAVARHAARPDLQAAWQAWRENPELVPGRFPGRDPNNPNLLLADPAVAAFDALACDMPWEDPDAAGLEHRSTAACDATIENLVVLVRKDSPVAAPVPWHRPGSCRTAARLVRQLPAHPDRGGGSEAAG